MNKEGVYVDKLENPINNDELGPSTNPMQTFHVQMRKTTNFQNHGPNIFTKMLMCKFQINELMANELSRSWTKDLY